jgi:hypothetical protein
MLKRRKPLKFMNDREKSILRLDMICRDKTLARDGYRCVLCGEKDAKLLQCGHLFSRVAYSTRWDERNLVCQCGPCNLRHELNPHILTAWFVRQFGLSVYETLLVKHKRISKLSTADLEALAEHIEAQDWGRPRYEPTPLIHALAQWRSP